MLDVAVRQRGGRDDDGGLPDHDAWARPRVHARHEQDDRPVPEVDAVAPLADPAQRSDPERLADPESGMRDRRDQDGEAEGGREVAALV